MTRDRSSEGIVWYRRRRGELTTGLLICNIKKLQMRFPLVEQPTGSGKTLQVVALTGVLLETRYDRIIICAPQQQIEEGFTGGQGGLGYGLVRFPDSSNTIRVPDGLIVASREVSYGSRARIQGYLNSYLPKGKWTWSV